MPEAPAAWHWCCPSHESHVTATEGWGASGKTWFLSLVLLNTMATSSLLS